MRKLLLVSLDFPYPPNYGGRADIWGRVLALRKAGYEVDLIATVKSRPSEEHIEVVCEYVSKILLVERDQSFRSVLSASPFQMSSRRGLKKVEISDEYFAVILEGDMSGPMLDNPKLHARHSILRVHNNEERHFMELSRSSGNLLKRVFFATESWKFHFASPALRKRCDALWFISRTEKEIFDKKEPSRGNSSWFVPPYVDSSNVLQRRALSGASVLFVGDISLPNNLAAVGWYLQYVHRELVDIPGYQFVIAGRSSIESSKRIDALTRSDEYVSVVENPIDLSAIYGRAVVFVNPIFHGAGLKLKTIHAIQNYLPVVSSQNGIEGTGLVNSKHVLIANDPARFADSIRRLIFDKQLAEEIVTAAHSFIVKEFDQVAIISKCLESLD